MKIRGARAQQKNEPARAVAGAQGAASGQAGLNSGVSQEFKSIMASFAGSGSASVASAEVDFETFDVDAIEPAHEPTQVQTSIQSSGLISAQVKQESENGKNDKQPAERQDEEVQIARAAVAEGKAKEQKDSESSKQENGAVEKKEGEEVSLESKANPEQKEVAPQAQEVKVEKESAEVVPVEEIVAEVKAAAEPVVAAEVKEVAAPEVKVEKLPAELEGKVKVEKSVQVEVAKAAAAQVEVAPQVQAEVKVSAQPKIEDTFKLQNLEPQASEVSAPAPQMIPPAAALLQMSLGMSMESRLMRPEMMDRSAASAAKDGISGINGASQARANSNNSQVAVPVQTREGQAQAEAKASQKVQVRSAVLKNLDRIESALKEVAKSHDGKTLSFRLDPPELGAVKIDVSLREGNLHARIVAESSAVAQVVREKAHDLQGILRKLGIECDRVSVSVHQEGMNSGEQSSSQQKAGQGEQGNGRNGSTPEFIGGAVRPEVAAQQLDHWIA